MKVSKSILSKVANRVATATLNGTDNTKKFWVETFRMLGFKKSTAITGATLMRDGFTERYAIQQMIKFEAC
jgi:hypothetical protein